MTDLWPWTERELLDRLRARHTTDRGNGPAWAYAEHVRNDAGHLASRTIDALAMSLYPSEGCALHAFEVKCSRADWLRELANPDKARAFEQHVDFFWLLAPPGVATYEELPEQWGMIAPVGAGLRVTRPAVALRPIVAFGASGPRPSPIDRGLVVALLRAQIRTVHGRLDADVTQNI